MEEVKIVAKIVAISRNHVIVDLLVEDLEIPYMDGLNPGEYFGKKCIVTISGSSESEKINHGKWIVTKIQKYEQPKPKP